MHWYGICLMSVWLQVQKDTYFCHIMIRVYVLICSISTLTGMSALSAQRPVLLQNPGLEAERKPGGIIPDWKTATAGATPDIQPGQWGVHLLPEEGSSYVGLITREDGSREGIGQHLKSALEAGKCYTMTIALTKARDYAGHNWPVVLKIRGGTGSSQPLKLLASSAPVSNQTWQTYIFEFTPSEPVRYIVFEAAPVPGIVKPYRGNLLIDNISPIKQCIRASLQRRDPPDYLYLR